MLKATQVIIATHAKCNLMFQKPKIENRYHALNTRERDKKKIRPKVNDL